MSPGLEFDKAFCLLPLVKTQRRDNQSALLSIAPALAVVAFLVSGLLLVRSSVWIGDDNEMNLVSRWHGPEVCVEEDVVSSSFFSRVIFCGTYGRLGVFQLGNVSKCKCMLIRNAFYD